MPGRGREGAQGAAGLRHAGHRRHEGLHQFRQGGEGAEVRDGVPADQPPAGLPDLRSGRRVPTAGSGRGLRQVRIALPGREARGVPQERRSADLDGRDDALHPLHALRPLRPGGRRRDGAGHAQSRRAFRDHHVRRPDRRLRTVGQHDRPVPGRRADQQAVPLPGPHVGAGTPQVGVAARRPGRQRDRPDQEPARDARAAAGKRSHQRMLAVRQGPLRLRGPQQRRAPDPADAQAGRSVANRGLDDGAGVCRQRPERDQARPRRRADRCAGQPAQHAGRAVPAAKAGARHRQRQRRLPSAPVRFLRQADGRAVAGHADRRGVAAAAHAGGGRLPAQGSSAAGRASAPGRQEGCAAERDRCRRRRPADAGDATAGCAVAVAVAAVGGGRGDRCRRQCRPSGRYRRRRSRRNRQAYRREPGFGRAQGRVPGQCRRGPSAVLQAACAGPVGRAADRRDAGLPDRSREHRRRLPRRCAAARQWPGRRRHAGAAAPRLRHRGGRAGIRCGEPAAGACRAGASRYRGRAVAVRLARRDGIRRRAAAGRAVHGNLGHLRQLRRLAAKLQRCGPQPGRFASGVEGAARAG